MANPIPEGYELLSGRSRVNAQQALATAEERGLDPQTVLTRSDGFLIPLGDSELPADAKPADADAKKTGPDEAVVEEIVLPTKDNTGDEIDAFAAEHNVTYDGIEAKNAEKPTKAEKAAHIEKVYAQRAAENDAKAAAGEPVGLDGDESGATVRLQNPVSLNDDGLPVVNDTKGAE